MEFRSPGINGLTLFFPASSFRAQFMAEPTPDSPVPPRPPEAAKVQPKKETVRIALPPKPTAAPTIKLPSLPPTGATPAAAPGTAAPTAARPASAPVAATTAQVPRPPAPPTAGAPTASRPGTAVSKPPAPAPVKAAPQPAAKAPASARTVGALDTALAVVAMVIGIAALVSVLLLVMGDFGSIK